MVHLGPKEPPARRETIAYLPEELKAPLQHLEEILSIDTKQLKEIVDHFVKELTKGLSKEGGSIPMNVAWVMDYPEGNEIGTYLALDMGGTNLRVAEVTLDGKRGFDTVQSKYKMAEEMKWGTADELWGFVAESIGKFLDHYHPDSNDNVHIGFTFSYPCTQDAINHGVLQRWTKGFDIDGVEGKDVAPMLQKALDDRKINVTVGAVINDTTGTLVASNYVDPEMEMGCIFGTGCNAAYYEVVKNIPKIEGKLPKDIGPDSWMAINCEYGAFDSEHVILPRTKYDVRLDDESPRPNQQAFEKMIAGYTLGELLRFILQDLIEQKLIFKGQPTDKLNHPFIMNAEFLSKIETDPWENLSDTEALFLEELSIQTTDAERTLIRRVAELLGTRAARLSMCGVAAMSIKRGLKAAHAGADGSVFNKYPHFRERGAQALAEILDWKMEPKDYPIVVLPAEDGSGAGAAIIAAITKKRTDKGLSVGLAK